MLRTAASGLHLLADGEVVTDVARLGEYLPAELGELLAIKQRGERQELEAAHARQWRVRLTQAIDAIDTAWPKSVLPPEPPVAAVEAVDAWLRDVRKSHW